ncbi:MAG TPA: DUF6470 family protein [Bacillota bacterium]|nr:DUF6470 family protein [Bacillota bacterium]
MQVPQIRIHSQFAKIGMNQQFASLNIQQPKADVTIKQPAAKMGIKSPLGELTIDQSQAFAEANLMTTWRLIEKQAARGQQAATEGTARRASQGDELMKIENQNDPIIHQAHENGSRQQKSISLKYIPSPLSVNINYVPADVQLDVQTEAPIIQASPNKPVIDFEPSVIDIYMKQDASLDIDFVNHFQATV